MPNIHYKQYIMIIRPLCEKVTRAKFGVHCAHSSLTACRNAELKHQERLNEWFFQNEQVKIIKEVNTYQKLENIINKTREQDLPYAMISDAGFSDELARGDVIMGCVGPITEEEARLLGVWRLSNYKK